MGNNVLLVLNPLHFERPEWHRLASEQPASSYSFELDMSRGIEVEDETQDGNREHYAVSAYNHGVLSLCF